MELFHCCHPGCTTKFSPATENVSVAYDQAVMHGWFKGENGWLCAQHKTPHATPPAVGPSSQASKTTTNSPRRSKRSSQKGVVILAAILVVIILAIIGANSGGNGSNNASYKAGFHAGVSYSGISLGGSNASYTCGQLWTQVSGNYNEGDWMSGCKDGINS
jgi:hypothetical protein